MSIVIKPKSLEVMHLSNNAEVIEDSGYGDQMRGTKALQDFLRKDMLTIEEDGGMGFSPFHAIQYVQCENGEKTVYDVTDATCLGDDACGGQPTITFDSDSITAEAGTEFDPNEGVTAKDGNGNMLSVTACIPITTEDSVILMTENSVDILYA